MGKEIIFYKKGFRITENGDILNPKGKTLTPTPTNRGYVPLSCKHEGETIKGSAHRLQAFQKYDEALLWKGMEVRHKNGIKTDNSFNNILIGTHSQNMMDVPESIRISRALQASILRRKHNKMEIIKFHKNNGNSYKKTKAEFNISSSGTLNYILNGRKRKQT